MKNIESTEDWYCCTGVRLLKTAVVPRWALIMAHCISARFSKMTRLFNIYSRYSNLGFNKRSVGGKSDFAFLWCIPLGVAARKMSQKTQLQKIEMVIRLFHFQNQIFRSSTFSP